MSRVGKYPVAVPDGVEVILGEGFVTVKGKLGELIVPILENSAASIADKLVTVTPVNASKKAKQAWGTTRALIQNAVTGVSEGFKRELEINGVGYRAQMQGKNLKLQLGLSHDVDFPVPEDVTITLEGDRKNVIAISGISKQRIGKVASDIRKYRPPEPYKGKGVKYMEERIVRKEGKKK